MGCDHSDYVSPLVWSCMIFGLIMCDYKSNFVLLLVQLGVTIGRIVCDN